MASTQKQLSILLIQKSSWFKNKDGEERKKLEREKEALMKAAGRPLGWKRTQKEKLASLEDKLAEQLTSDIQKYHEKWEARYLRDFEQMEKWFFGLGKENRKDLVFVLHTI